jgi:hypothetical protein
MYGRHVVGWTPPFCSTKGMLPDVYIQIEVDEHGHVDTPCWDENTRLEIIAADVGTPGVVLRINADAAPLLRRRKRKDGARGALERPALFWQHRPRNVPAAAK